jgi:hypothetical protein
MAIGGGQGDGRHSRVPQVVETVRARVRRAICCMFAGSDDLTAHDRFRCYDGDHASDDLT